MSPGPEERSDGGLRECDFTVLFLIEEHSGYLLREGQSTELYEALLACCEAAHNAVEPVSGKGRSMVKQQAEAGCIDAQALSVFSRLCVIGNVHAEQQREVAVDVASPQVRHGPSVAGRR